METPVMVLLSAVARTVMPASVVSIGEYELLRTVPPVMVLLMLLAI